MSELLGASASAVQVRGRKKKTQNKGIPNGYVHKIWYERCEYQNIRGDGVQAEILLCIC